MTRKDIQDFINSKNYDLRISHNGRWIDQKCTPDVLWSISDFVYNYVFESKIKDTFNASDIWHSEYASETIANTYSKPGTADISAKHEYDKVFSQPLCLLCNAEVIEDISTTIRHCYKVKEPAVLAFIARNDSNAMYFLELYIEKVLRDSDIYCYFEDFFSNQDKIYFNRLKDAYITFIQDNTNIKKDFEPKRIFTKVLNPLARKYNKKGTESGCLSNNIITTSELMYNRDNFRDIYAQKPKGTSRQDWLAQHPEINRRDGYFEQQMNKAKRILRDFICTFRNGKSELTMFSTELPDNAPATQIHHIFPKSDFPEIMHYLENLIPLTPNQHYGYAHPNNNTQMINPITQQELLRAKAGSIQQNLLVESEKIYDFNKFLYVLSVGWNDLNVLNIQENNFSDVIYEINRHY